MNTIRITIIHKKLLKFSVSNQLGNKGTKKTRNTKTTKEQPRIFDPRKQDRKN